MNTSVLKSNLKQLIKSKKILAITALLIALVIVLGVKSFASSGDKDDTTTAGTAMTSADIAQVDADINAQPLDDNQAIAPAQILNYSPKNDEKGIDSSVNPSITFSNDLDVATVNPDTVKLFKYTDNTQIPVSVIYSSRMITIAPTSGLNGITKYYPIIDGVKDILGNTVSGFGIAEKDLHDFTVADTTKPTAALRTPTPGSTGVEPKVYIYIRFSEVTNKATLNKNNIHLRKYSNNSIVPGVLVKGASGTTLGIRIASGLDYDTKYYIEITPGVTDIAGNPFDDSWSIAKKSYHSFTTKKANYAVAAAKIANAEFEKNPFRKEGPNNSGWVIKYQKVGGCGSGNAWCAAFVSWSFSQTGLPANKRPHDCLALGVQAWFTRYQKTISINNTIPRVGDIVTFPTGGGHGHIGIVVGNNVRAHTITVVEGNHQDELYRHVYQNYGRGHWTKVGRWVK